MGQSKRPGARRQLKCELTGGCQGAAESEIRQGGIDRTGLALAKRPSRKK